MHLNTFDCALQSPAILFCIDTIIICSIKTHCKQLVLKGFSIVLKWNDPNRSAKTLLDKAQENNNSRVKRLQGVQNNNVMTHVNTGLYETDAVSRGPSFT